MSSNWPVMGLRQTLESAGNSRVYDADTAGPSRAQQATAGLATPDPASDLKFQVYEQLLRELDLTRILGA